MSVVVTWLGHSAFELNIDGHSALIDPWLTGNPVAAKQAADVNPEIIFLSHAHGDHLGDTVGIAQRTDALVVANNEIANWLTAHGVKKVHGQNPGGGHDHGFVHARWTMAHHSSSFPDGAYGGEPNGIILTTPDGKKIYFAGDTCLFIDMQLIGDRGIDLAILPIGDNFTMDPEDSLRAIQFIRPKFVIPMHYNTFPLLAQDAGKWARAVTSETSAKPIVLESGASFTLE